MSEHETSRTLVKSVPELWAECSDAAALARHLGAFGEIRITRLEPESTVAWEGDAARGTVRLEAAGWGTRVTLTVAAEAAAAPEAAVAPDAPEAAVAREAAVAPEAAAPPEPETAPDADPPVADPPPRRGFFARLFRRRRPEPEVPPPGPEPIPEPEPPAPEPAPDPLPIPARGADALAAALDSLGRAHHRPFSRG